MKPGTRIVSVAALPEPQTAIKDLAGGRVLSAMFWIISYGVRSRARRAGVSYRYLFMHPSGSELAELAELIEQRRTEGHRRQDISICENLGRSGLCRKRTRQGQSRRDDELTVCLASCAKGRETIAAHGTRSASFRSAAQARPVSGRSSPQPSSANGRGERQLTTRPRHGFAKARRARLAPDAGTVAMPRLSTPKTTTRRPLKGGTNG